MATAPQGDRVRAAGSQHLQLLPRRSGRGTPADSRQRDHRASGGSRCAARHRHTNLTTAWVTIYTASEAATGSKTVSQEGKKLARENLQLMLFLNLVKLMEMFPRQPEKLALYMQQHLLENPESPEEPEPPPGP
ncbi:MAG: hypothetical protein R3F13_01350 [Prosthecobacter sp.]